MADDDNKLEHELKPKFMDPKLAKAAWTGDVNFLRKAVADCEAINDYSYFLPTFTSQNTDDDDEIEIEGNIFHLAAWEGQVEFFKEAMESLSRKQSVVQVLLSHQQQIGQLALQVPLSHQLTIRQWRRFSKVNPLHVAAEKGAVEIVKLIREFYTSLPAHPSPEQISSNNNRQPWLAQDSGGRTPLLVALENKKEECAEVLMSMDVELLVTNITDKDGRSPLYHAVENGCQQVALDILNSAHPYSLSGSDDQTPLHVVPNCSEEVCRLLLEKHPQLLKTIDSKRCTVMHSWVSNSNLGATVWPFEYLLLDDSTNIAPALRMDFLKLLIQTDKYGENPLHYAAKVEATSIVCILVEAYQKERIAKKTTLSCLFENPVPWLRKNYYGRRTPLDIALDVNTEEVALCFLSPEINSILECQDYKNNYLLLALEKKWDKFAQGILDIQKEHGWSTGLTGGHGRNALHSSLKYKEEVGTWLVTQLPALIWEQDDDGKTPFDEASEAKATWLIDAMLKADPSLLKKKPWPWAEACKRGESTTILCIIHRCLNFRDICIELKDTPLHYLRLKSGYHHYQEFLKVPMMSEFKNFQDWNGATPLHQAIRNRNIHLTEALLTIGDVDRSIKDRKGNSPMDLLADVCLKEPAWDEMCQRNGIIPGLKTTYFQDKTNLLEVRNTLSVVAALLATITFTAGFTLPGGFNSDSGKAVLGEKAAFLVFLLADVFAMCCSMLVLVFFIWSMVCDKNQSLVLIDRSIPLLMVALYSTLLAFMTGIYIVMPHKSLWVVIIILVMCSLIIISSKRSFMFKVLNKLNSGANRERRDKFILLEQGTSTSTVKEGRSSEQETERAEAAEDGSSTE